MFEARMPKPSYREVFTAACPASLAERGHVPDVVVVAANLR
ncbi:hypothetical protein JCM19236_145 [Vibrio sp. JCM 19236]|nr:hypothetical protein JCM19236_145 [Vibrio sp. JCM 19236]